MGSSSDEKGKSKKKDKKDKKDKKEKKQRRDRSRSRSKSKEKVKPPTVAPELEKKTSIEPFDPRKVTREDLREFDKEKKRDFKPIKKKEPPVFDKTITTAAPKMIEVYVNDRLGKKVRVKCCLTDTIGDLKKLIAFQTGTKAEKIRLQKWYNIYKDHVTLDDYEIRDGMGLEMYYN